MALALSGFVILGQYALRIDRAEKLASITYGQAYKGHKIIPSKIAEKVGLDEDCLPALLIGLGFHQHMDEEGKRYFQPGRSKNKNSKRKIPSQHHIRKKPINPDSPFAPLKELNNVSK